MTNIRALLVPDFEDPPCAQAAPDAWFATDTDETGHGLRRHALAVCMSCPHRVPCRDFARADRVVGIWGGEDETTRREWQRVHTPELLSRRYVVRRYAS